MTRKVLLDDEQNFAVEGLLIFLYSGRYPINEIKSTVPEDKRYIHLALLQIADKRHVPLLYALAVDQLLKLLQPANVAQFWETIRMIWSMDIPVPKEIQDKVASLVSEGKLEECGTDVLTDVFGEKGSLARTVAAGLAKRIPIETSNFGTWTTYDPNLVPVKKSRRGH